MNIRLSKDQVRLRLTQSEAEELIGSRRLTEEVCLPQGARICFGVELIEGPELSFDARNSMLFFKVPGTELSALLEAPERKDLSLSRVQETESSRSITLVFEIDAFSRTKLSRSRI